MARGWVRHCLSLQSPPIVALVALRRRWICKRVDVVLLAIEEVELDVRVDSLNRYSPSYYGKKADYLKAAFSRPASLAPAAAKRRSITGVYL